MEGSLVDIRASYLSGTPSQKTGTSPSNCLLLDNRLFMNDPLPKSGLDLDWAKQTLTPLRSIHPLTKSSQPKVFNLNYCSPV